MMRSNKAAAGEIPAFAADPDTISDSGSSTSPPPQPGRRGQTYSTVLQEQEEVRSGAPVIRPTPPPVAVEEMEITSPVVAEGMAETTATNRNEYLRSYGKIPMLSPQPLGPHLNNAKLAPPPDASQRQARPRLNRPLICAYCNCAFCFGADEVDSVHPSWWHDYPAPREPITLNLFTPPPVGPLYLDGDRWGPGAKPEWLLVCSNEQHFRDTMGMLQHLPGAKPPALVWKCAITCLRVLPTVVGSEEGASSSDLRADPVPPPEPSTYAGAYWNYVEPGHEDMVELKLHNDPLKLSLGPL